MNLRNNENNTDGGFLQSGHWMNFQKAVGRKVKMVENEGGRALMVEYQLPVVGGYFFVPRGPIIAGQCSKTGMKSLVEKMVSAAKEARCGWIRVEPQNDNDWQAVKNCLEADFSIVKSKKNHEPPQTLMLDLSRTEDELLSAMKPKTRYNIRLAEKRGVEIITSRRAEDIEIFCDMVEETARRDRVIAHPRSYYIKMLETIPDEALRLYLARFGEKIIAGGLISFAGGVATYQHGASSNEHRNVMAPYLLQWQAIKDAKNQGNLKYDFGGLRLEEKKESTSWKGITRFKIGFCPQGGVVNFPGCYDIIINRKKYWLYRGLQAVKDTKKYIKTI